MVKNIDPAVSAYFAEIGRKSGQKLRDERGPEYFSKISKMRKRFGRLPKAKPEVAS